MRTNRLLHSHRFVCTSVIAYAYRARLTSSWGSAASRATGRSFLAVPDAAARRLQRLVKQTPATSNRLRRVQHATQGFVDRSVRRKGLRNSRLQENEVGASAEPGRVLASDAAPHRREVILSAHLGIVRVANLAHRIVAPVWLLAVR